MNVQNISYSLFLLMSLLKVSVKYVSSIGPVKNGSVSGGASDKAEDLSSILGTHKERTDFHRSMAYTF